LLFDETVDALIFGAGIVTGTVCSRGFSSRPWFRSRVEPAVSVGLQ
jgi:hypothetical protein